MSDRNKDEAALGPADQPPPPVPHGNRDGFGNGNGKGLGIGIGNELGVGTPAQEEGNGDGVAKNRIAHVLPPGDGEAPVGGGPAAPEGARLRDDADHANAREADADKADADKADADKADADKADADKADADKADADKADADKADADKADAAREAAAREAQARAAVDAQGNAPGKAQAEAQAGVGGAEADAGAGAGANGAAAGIAVEAKVGAGAPAARSAGCYRVVPYNPKQLADARLPDGAFYVVVRMDAPVGVVPDDQATLCRDVNRVLEALGTLSPKRKEEVATYYARLKEMAEVGLTGDWARPGLVRTEIASLQEEILRQEGSVVKTAYMTNLGKVAATLAVPAVVVAALAAVTERFEPLLRTVEPFKSIPPAGIGLLTYAQTVCTALLLAGAALGAWLSFGAQEGFAFERLLILEEDYLGPKTRMGFAVAISLVLALLFHTKLVVVGVGDVTTEKVFQQPVVALVLGLIAGFGSKAVARLVSATFNRFIGSTDAKDATPAPAAAADVKVKVETPIVGGAAAVAGGVAGAPNGAAPAAGGAAA